MGPDAGGLHLPGLEACTGMLQGGGQSQAAGIIWKNRVWGGPPRRGHHKGGAREEGRGGCRIPPPPPSCRGDAEPPPRFPPRVYPIFRTHSGGAAPAGCHWGAKSSGCGFASAPWAFLKPRSFGAPRPPWGVRKTGVEGEKKNKGKREWGEKYKRRR